MAKRPAWGLSLPLLLSLPCCFGGVGEAVGEWGSGNGWLCAKPTTLEQPRERLAKDSCWRVDVPDGFGVTEVGSDCENAPACLVTASTRVSRQLLNWEAEGESNPETWREVHCDATCDD